VATARLVSEAGPAPDISSDETTVDAVLKGMAQFRVLNTCLHLGFRADLADRVEARIP
jgi:hypothetical protein